MKINNLKNDKLSLASKSMMKFFELLVVYISSAASIAKGATHFLRFRQFQILKCDNGFKDTLTSKIGGANAFLRCKSLSREDRRVLQGYSVV